MLWLIGLLLAGLVLYVVYRIVSNKADAAFEDQPVVEEVKQQVVETLDVNKDGKVDLADVKEVAKKVKKSAKKAVSKAKKPKLKVAK